MVAITPDAKTVNRLVEQGEFLLKTFHQEYAKDRTSRETEFSRGNLAGWRHTLHTIYGDGEASAIIDRVRNSTKLPIPHSGPLAPDGSGYYGLDSGADM
jgi:Tfp pilus assembly protein PilV